MKISVIGAGAIGSVVAAFLHKAGEDVVLIGRQDHVDEINANGLRIHGVNGDECFQVKAATQLDQAYDLNIMATKTQDLERAFQENAEYLATDECKILTTQNGVQADNILSSHYYQDQQFSSIVMFGATYVQPGEVTYNFPGDWIIGRPFASIDPMAHEVARVLNQTPLNVVVTQDIIGMKWLKLFVNFNNCIPALIGKSMQETFTDIDLCKLSVALLSEGVDIVKKANIELVSLPNFPVERIYGLAEMPLDQAAGIIQKTLTTLSKEPLYGSVLQSIMRGRTSEIDFINGEVVVVGKAMQQAVPLNKKVVDLVHQVERSGKYFSVSEVKKEFEFIKT